MNLLASEVRKLRTVITTWVLSGVGLALVLLVAALTLFLDPTTMGGASFSGSDLELAAVLDNIGQGSVIVLVVALLAMTTEFRHGTIGRTLQITPSRSRVLFGKIAASSLYALGFFLVALVLIGVLVLLAAAGQGASLQPGREVAELLWQAPLALVLTAVFGVTFGALVRNQVVAITVTLIWFLMLESLIAWQLPRIGRFLPFTAMSAVFMSPETAANVPEGMLQPLAAGPALAVFFGYIVAMSAAALVLLRYRDV